MSNERDKEQAFADGFDAGQNEALGFINTQYAEAMKAAMEICADHGFATGHGDTLADILREINGQIKERAAP